MVTCSASTSIGKITQKSGEPDTCNCGQATKAKKYSWGIEHQLKSTLSIYNNVDTEHFFIIQDKYFSEKGRHLKKEENLVI